MVSLLSAVRSPIFPADHAFGRWHPVDLSASIAESALAQAGVEPRYVDEIWVGCEEPVGAQGADMARAIALAAGWPDHLSGTVVDRGESSGSAALHAAAASIAAGQIRTALVLGVHSASTVTPGASALGRLYGRPWGDAPGLRYADEGGLLPGPRAAERIARTTGITRQRQDAWSARSHRLRSEARTPAIVDVAAKPGDGTALQRGTPVSTDQLRALPIEMADQPPMFDEDGTVTAATFAPPADGVCAMVLSHDGNDVPRLVGTGRWAGSAVDPTGGVNGAVAAALAHHDLAAVSIDQWEILERTAAGALSAVDLLARLGVDAQRINPRGGTLAVGDAGAAEDLRLSVDGAIELEPGQTLAAVAYGLSGAAVSVWSRQ